MAPKRAVRKIKKVVPTTVDAATNKVPSGPPFSTAPPLPETPMHRVLYADKPLSLDHYFGHSGYMDYNVTFGLRRELPITTDGSLERAMTIHRVNHSNFRAIITDADFVMSPDRAKINKPKFFFGDSIKADDAMVCIEDYEAMDQVASRFLLLPPMKQMYPLSYFQSISCGRCLGWDLVEERSKVPVGTLTYPTVRSCDVRGLTPGEFHNVDSSCERVVPANIFIRQFIAAQGEFPAQEFRAPGWTYSLEGGWWARMIDFVVSELHAPLILSGLAIPVMAMRNGIIQSSYNFFAILENYNPDTCTFFTPVGELGFALHELYTVSGLPFGELPYEEFVPGTDELSFLKTVHPEIHATLWEVMCHFHICVQLTGLRSGGVKQMSWAEYLFQNLHSKDAAVTRLPASPPEVIAARIHASSAAKFRSFHNQAGTPISDTALLAGFIMIWLKRCVVPSRPIESILVEVVYPAVLLAHGRPISLLSAMGSCLQRGLRELTSEFLDVREIGPSGDKRLKTPQPRVPVPYTYLVAWFVMHCPVLMTGVSDIEDPFIPFAQRFKSAQWTYTYIVPARQLLSKADNYQVFCCCPDFDGVEDRCQMFMDVGPGGFTSLSEGIFRWLITIRPGYLVFRLGDRCIIEPYLPSRFARQFGYDQLYVGNPNPQLALIGNLYEGARAWYYWTAGNSSAAFLLPSSMPNCYMVLGFCDWYRRTAEIPEYDIYTSCLKDIKGMYESRKDSKSTRLKGINEYLICEQEALKACMVKKEYIGIDTRQEKMAGKRALTAEEAACYEKRARQGITTRSHSHGRPKLMQEAIRSAPTRGEEKKPTAEFVSQLPILPSTASTKGKREVFVVDENTLIPAAFCLKFYVKELESLLRFAANYVMCGRGSFEAYRPHISKLLNSVERVGGADWLKHCAIGISYVEANLQAYQELKRVDLEAEITKSLIEARAERASQKETAMTDAQLKEKVSERVRADHNSKLADLTLRLTAIHFTNPGF